MIKAQLLPALLMTVALTLFTGLVFPGIVWLLGQAMFSYQANGSIVEQGGKTIGSEIIGQVFTTTQYFHPRPSAAGSGYDPLGSSGTNLGPTSKKLFAGIQDDPETKDADESYSGVEDLAKAYRAENSLSAEMLLPADAVTRSASGLDPHISPRNALLQIARIAQARGVSDAQVRTLVEQNTEGRFLGIFGEPRVNVLKLNLALDKQFKH